MYLKYNLRQKLYLEKKNKENKIKMFQEKNLLRKTKYKYFFLKNLKTENLQNYL